MPSNRKPLVLLIEDEQAIADSVVYALATEGFEPHWCDTGAAGLHACREQTPDLILLDIGLPDGNGFELFQQLRRDTLIPIIFLTARSEEIDRVVGLEMGADDYISKPFSPRELTARVRAVLRRAVDTSATALKLDFQIDAERLQIRYRDEVLALSRYEYRLLKLLIEHPERVFSREQLLQQVWEHPEHSLDRTVDTHIKTLRAKLRDRDPAANPIKTHRGVGYSFSL
jgi:two-component system catabolic regulation response regulator CreB